MYLKVDNSDGKGGNITSRYLVIKEVLKKNKDS
jgi:hypothetical protein